jgi:hypothetical protein
MFYLDYQACDMLQEKLKNVYFERQSFPFSRFLRLIFDKQYLVLIDFWSGTYRYKRIG